MSTIETALRLTSSLERDGFDCAVGGALALGYWAVPRATLDIDLAVAADAARTPDLIEAMRRIGCEIDVDRALRSAERGDFGARFEGVRVDVFLPVTPLAERALENRVQVPLGAGSIWIISAEDCVLLKLLYARPKDFADLESLFAARGDQLDYEELDAWVESAFGPSDSRTIRYRELRDRVRGG